MGAADAVEELEVDPARVQGWLADGGADVVDVREDAERAAGHIAGTRHVALVELAAQAQTLPRDRPVVFYCRVGNRSLMAAQALRASGYEAYSMRGGLVRWAHEDRPLSPDGGYVADH